MNYCFHLLAIHPLDLFEGVMRCLGDGKEKLLWEGVQEACLGRHDDRGLGHPEDTQRMERWDTEREGKEVNSACSHQSLLSCLSHTTHHFVQGNVTKRNNPGKE